MPQAQTNQGIKFVKFDFWLLRTAAFSIIIAYERFFLQNLISKLCLAKGNMKFYQPNEQGGYCGFGQK